jgi:hypothetical protein
MSYASQPGGDHHGAPGEADGVVPDGVTVFDDDYPAVANLDPALLRALRPAAKRTLPDGSARSAQNTLGIELVSTRSPHARRKHE